MKAFSKNTAVLATAAVALLSDRHRSASTWLVNAAVRK